jgi:hypothetical protein
MAKIIMTLIKYAFFIGIGGQLVDATIALRNEAYREIRHGLVSLREFNRLLVKTP